MQIRVARMHSSGLSIRRGLNEPVDPVSISVILPAHNEEAVIGICLDSLLAMSWADLEVIVVADRCTDATESIVMERASKDDRVCLIRNNDCPPNWAGKCNAARLGAERAKGEWLAFIDADTCASPQLMRAAMAEAQRRDTALLSLLTDLTCQHWYERSAQPVAMMMLMSIYPPDRVNREDHPKPFANGQFMLINRQWYDRIDGHASVKDALLEDIAMAQAINAAGGRGHILRADGLLSCSMYESRSALHEGWARIFIESSGRNVGKLRSYAVRQLLMGWLSPLNSVVAIVLGFLAMSTLGDWAIYSGSIAILVQLMALAWIWHIGRQPIWSILLFPLGTWDVFQILRRGANMLRNREPVRWGGREYVLERTDG